jgi:mono/diheme cytochrome c family protein
MIALKILKVCLGVVLAAETFILTGCGASPGGTDTASTANDVPIAYVKRPINSQSMNSAVGNPTDSVTFHRGGDLYIRDISSPSATEKNITASYTQGRGDVSDPEVSYDGKKILFSMRGPADSTWNIWEYNRDANTLRRVIPDNTEANKGDDVDPAYLPDGRIVFSSNRQQKSILTVGYKYVDEYDRETSTVLHVMNADGSGIEQISFNQSHDRNPTVLMDGHIMYSRWDHVGGRNQFSIFRANLDGTGMFIHYGAHSQVVSYLHPREMPDGRIMSDAMPLSRTNEGGALLIIDSDNFSEIDQPAPGVSGTAQTQASYAPIDFGSRVVSANGRFTTPYPLWDGSHRALVSFTPGGRTVQQTQTSLITGQPVTVDVEKTPAYGVYMLDQDTKTLRAIVLPKVNANGDPVEFVTDAVALMPRPKPKLLAASSVDPVRQGRNMVSITVGSVYDTEPERNRMTNNVLSAQEKTDGIIIPMKDNRTNLCPDGRPRYPNCDTRSQVADVAKLKDPSPTTGTLPDKRPGRFARIVKAVPTPRGISREALGETDFEMQQIVGYTEVEPDGSMAFEIPADMPIGISVLDRFGRALQTHTSWIQGRPGEAVFCNGCHSPRKGATSALNGTNLTQNNHVLSLRLSNGSVVPGKDGEIMAQTRFNEEFSLGASKVLPKPDIQYTDVWTPDTDANGNPLTKGTPINITYAALTTTAPATSSPIVINYKDHIQPILNKSCAVGCHGVSGSAQSTLDLSDSISGTGRVASYDALMIGKPKLVNGLPVLIERDGEIVVDREDPLAEPGLARAASLIKDWIFTEGLDRSPAAVTADTVNHPAMLNVSEKRVIAEWIDLGGTYYNDPCETRDASGNCTKFRTVTGLDQTVFENRVQPLMLTVCAGCHVAVGRAAGDPPFQAKRLVLTGSVEGDFNVTASMVNNVCNPAMSYLLRYPTSTGNQSAVPPEPMHPHVLDSTSPLYTEIMQWITAAQAANGC